LPMSCNPFVVFGFFLSTEQKWLIPCQMSRLSLRRKKFEVWFGYQNWGEVTQGEGFRTFICPELNLI
jgi:hypothetical protein